MVGVFANPPGGCCCANPPWFDVWYCYSFDPLDPTWINDTAFGNLFITSGMMPAFSASVVVSPRRWYEELGTQDWYNSYDLENYCIVPSIRAAGFLQVADFGSNLYTIERDASGNEYFVRYQSGTEMSRLSTADMTFTYDLPVSGLREVLLAPNLSGPIQATGDPFRVFGDVTGIWVRTPEYFLVIKFADIDYISSSWVAGDFKIGGSCEINVHEVGIVTTTPPLFTPFGTLATIGGYAVGKLTHADGTYTNYDGRLVSNTVLNGTVIYTQPGGAGYFEYEGETLLLTPQVVEFEVSSIGMFSRDNLAAVVKYNSVEPTVSISPGIPDQSTTMYLEFHVGELDTTTNDKGAVWFRLQGAEAGTLMKRVECEVTWSYEAPDYLGATVPPIWGKWLWFHAHDGRWAGVIAYANLTSPRANDLTVTYTQELLIDGIVVRTIQNSVPRFSLDDPDTAYNSAVHPALGLPIVCRRTDDTEHQPTVVALSRVKFSSLPTVSQPLGTVDPECTEEAYTEFVIYNNQGEVYRSPLLYDGVYVWGSSSRWIYVAHTDEGLESVVTEGVFADRRDADKAGGEFAGNPVQIFMYSHDGREIVPVGAISPDLYDGKYVIKGLGPGPGNVTALGLGAVYPPFNVRSLGGWIYPPIEPFFADPLSEPGDCLAILKHPTYGPPATWAEMWESRIL